MVFIVVVFNLFFILLIYNNDCCLLLIGMIKCLFFFNCLYKFCGKLLVVVVMIMVLNGFFEFYFF